MKAPRIATDLNATSYHVKGSISRTTTIEGDATPGQSTIASGTIVGGTTAQFGVTTARGGLQSLTYASRGEVRDLNLMKVGQAFQIASIATPQYDSRINATYAR